ncbi:MAG: hypothetical protein II842_17330 [Butyrivibrio sp.]|nr:hypothetical protein [Butyrivibrio sp.]
MIPLEWDECPECDTCELILSFLELTDSLVRDLQHLKAETLRARYQWWKQLDPDKNRITTVDLLSNLEMPHYDNQAYQEYMRIYYNGGDPLEFKEFSDSMINIANGTDDYKY